MRTEVAIIGGGPSGLLLSQLLMRQGIATVVLERRSRAHVLSRIRAGVLEAGTVRLLAEAGLGARVAAEGLVHDGCLISDGDRQVRIAFDALCGRSVTVFGQTEVTKDLYAAQEALGATLLTGVEAVALYDLATDRPYVTYRHDGAERRLDCDYVAGCDGFHGVSRQSIPRAVRRQVEKVYPFGWLGVLTETPPVSDELVYVGHPRGFALCSLRNLHLSRYYIQAPTDGGAERWSDDAFWDELRRRLPEELAERLVIGPSIEKSMAPLRSFVCEPMQWERLFLCGDAAHIVPPTGAKGLNLAVSDVHYLSRALIARYVANDPSWLAQYSRDALARVWLAVRFSWSMTTLLHRFPDGTPFDRRLQQAELDHLAQSESARRVLAENYTGLPFEELA